jgi:hypothetical protein
MKTLGLILGGLALSVAGLLVACTPEEEDIESDEARVEAQDPLEGAYKKMGGTPVHFVFKRNEDGKNGTFFGEIEIEGEAQRAKGSVKLTRDNLGTKFTLTPEGAPTSSTSGSKPEDGGTTDGGAKVDPRPLAQQAFSGTMHYLKIGKNKTILVRGDANGKTAHYKKLKSWCVKAVDCKSDVQATGLDCDDSVGCSKNACICRSDE